MKQLQTTELCFDLPPEDFNIIVNYKHFDYLIAKPKCIFQYDSEYNTTLPYFITLIHSDPNNTEERSMIRDTWAHHDRRTKTYFLLGAVDSKEKQRLIEKEDADFDDIIQGNFMDTNRNSTYKHVMGLKWFTYNCAEAKYLVKMDDTVFMNTPNVYKYLTNNSESQDFIMGAYTPPGLTPRTGTFAVDFEEYPPKYLPSFVEKFAVIYSSRLAVELYKKSRWTQFVSIP